MISIENNQMLIIDKDMTFKNTDPKKIGLKRRKVKNIR